MKLNQLVSSFVGMVFVLTLLGIPTLVPITLLLFIVTGDIPNIHWSIPIIIGVLYSMVAAAVACNKMSPEKYIDTVKNNKMMFIGILLITSLLPIAQLAVTQEDEETADSEYIQVKYTKELENKLELYKNYYLASEFFNNELMEGFEDDKVLDDILEQDAAQWYFESKYTIDSLLNVYNNGEV